MALAYKLNILFAICNLNKISNTTVPRTLRVN